MHVKIHKLFEILLQSTDANPETAPEAVIGFSLSPSPKLGDFLADLDPNLSLDWSNQSFQGLPALRQHVLRCAGLGTQCALDDILITAGAAEANFLAITQLVQPGDEIIVDTPGWPQPVVLGEAIGAQIKRWWRREENGWRVDIEQLAGLISRRTRLIFLCNPNNPTGQVTSEAELCEVVRLADGVGAYILCDEVYAGLEWETVRAPAIASLYPRGISTGSVSKTLGLQGLRIGWLICRDPGLVRDAVILRENTSEIMNVMGEVIAEIALREPRYQQALTQARTTGLRNLQVLDRFITQRPELSWVRPAAGLIGLCRLHLAQQENGKQKERKKENGKKENGNEGKGMDGDELARRLLQPPYRTFLIPGSAYDLPNHIRLGVGGADSTLIETGLGRLAALLDSLRSF